MGTSASRADQPWSTSLKCLLANLRTLHISGEIRSKCLTFLCSEAWPQYSLDNGSQWPPTGTFDFNILPDLDNYCWKMGRWSEVPYVQAFWLLHSHPTLCTRCSPSEILLTMALPSPTPIPPLLLSPSASISTPPPSSSQPSPPVTSLLPLPRLRLSIHPFLCAHPFLTHQSAHTQVPGLLLICHQLPCFLSARWLARRVLPMSTCPFHSNILSIFNNG